MIRSTIDCGSSLLTTESMVNDHRSFTDYTPYDWKNPTMMKGPDDPDPKSARHLARGIIQYGPDEEDPRQVEEPLNCFIGIALYGDIENRLPRKLLPKE